MDYCRYIIGVGWPDDRPRPATNDPAKIGRGCGDGVWVGMNNPGEALRQILKWISLHRQQQP
jgi:hypothetical protein